MTNYTLESLISLSIVALRTIALDLNIKPIDSRRKASIIDCILEYQTNFLEIAEYIAYDLAGCKNDEGEVYVVLDVNDTNINLDNGCIDYYSGGSHTATECTYTDFEIDSVVTQLAYDLAAIKDQQTQIELKPLSDPKVAALHLFSGTYNTIWEPQYPTNSHGDTVDDGSVNFDTYLEKLGDLYTTEVGYLLPIEFSSENFTFESTSSPRYYNYSTDRLFVTLHNYDEQIEVLRDYANNLHDLFSQHLKDKYTSCSGYIPYYSNDIADWLDRDSSDLDHNEIGEYIAFYLSNENASCHQSVDDQIKDSLDDRLDNWVYSNYEYENLELLNAVYDAIEAKISIPVWNSDGELIEVLDPTDYYNDNTDIYCEIMSNRHSEVIILGQLYATH